MQLIEIKEIHAELLTLTGLHIGAGKDEAKIGGIDTQVIRDAKTGRPYIPGSSIKGKIRTLLEWSGGKIDMQGGGPYSSKDSNDLIPRIFGNGKIVGEYEGGPTRAVFRDCYMNNESARELAEVGALTEAKYEVSINRLKGSVGGGGPRNIERVPAGARFDLVILFKVFSLGGDNGKRDIEGYRLLREQGLTLLQMDALGGSGSRGYGAVSINILSETSAWKMP